jgi:phosphatidylserine decarboxylase
VAAHPGDRGFALLQYVLPKHLLSRFIYHFMRTRMRWLKNLTIAGFLRGYAINMQEAAETDPLSYPSFNAFFTRALARGARPVDGSEDGIISPVDGTVSQCGAIDGDAIIQAKGQHYSVRELLGGDSAAAARYRGGQFACIYLAPYDYHRMHMPVAGKVLQTLYIPGDLFSVNAATARTVPRLFSRNERVVCEFATKAGHHAFVMVGALFVGSIETVWNGEINPPPRPRKAVRSLPAGAGLELAKGAEIGRFNMGSTVVMLFEPGKISFHPAMVPGAVVRMGQPIGTITG